MKKILLFVLFIFIISNIYSVEKNINSNSQNTVKFENTSNDNQISQTQVSFNALKKLLTENYAFTGRERKKNWYIYGAVVFTGFAVVGLIAGGAMLGTYFYLNNVYSTGPFSSSSFQSSMSSSFTTGMLIGAIVAFTIGGLCLIPAIIFWVLFAKTFRKKVSKRIHFDMRNDQIGLCIKL